ncbi:MAG: 5'/3'-nucleotidase SurE [Planctomycetaceae bacterium]|nr:5'/3'-nucleotidase SurE [Planctomycetaceae bacterium]
MKFLLTNDDGIDSPGIKALEAAASRIGQVTVIAPDGELTGCSHRVTSHEALNVTERSPRHYAVDGTPADCVRLGLVHLAKDADWVLSGVNDGANLGINLLMSGTLAATREATLFERSAIGLSHYRRSGQVVDWEAATEATERVLRELLAKTPTPRAYWNVNFPAVLTEGKRGVCYCEVDQNPLPVEYRDENSSYRYCGVYPERKRTTGTDVDVCFSGSIAVSLVNVTIS